MVVNVQISFYEIEEVNTIIHNMSTNGINRYHYSKDKKYMQFLKKHNFTNNERVFDLYLRLCAEGLV